MTSEDDGENVVVVRNDAVYPIRRWYFDEAYGRYDIDLGDSHIGSGTLAELSVPADTVLDYGSDRGGAELRSLVAELYGRPSAEVGVTHGSQEALYLLYRSLLRPSDHVVVFSPGWQQMLEVPAAIGCRVDVVGVDDTGAPDLEEALRRVGPETRMVVVNSPGNPTGRRVRADAVETLVRALRTVAAVLVLDEEYVDDLGADSLLGRYEAAVSVSSLSKVYGFPGLRVGWLCGRADMVEAAMTYKHYTTIANSPLTERLAAEVLRQRAERVARYRAAIATGQKLLADWVSTHRHAVSMLEPEGTPFAWLRLLGAEPSLAFCRRALDSGVLLMPAECFGSQSAVRLTFGRPEPTLRAGLQRLGELL
jgi:aspartate/methionine/tyrosine aminotransferase